MRIIRLSVTKRKTNYVHHFDSVTLAYKFYLKHYSTFGDWWYYYKTAHTLLNRITDERTMEAIFDNVFKNAYIYIEF